MTAQVTFRQADERDLDLLAGMYDGAARWMLRNGIDQWKPGGKPVSHFRARVAAGEVWLATRDGAAVGAYELWWRTSRRGGRSRRSPGTCTG